MNIITQVKFSKSNSKHKKIKATFFDKNGKRLKTTHFGAKGMSDYTIHKDTERKQRYLNRHRKNENWNNFISAGSLSRYILWGKPTLRESISDYKKKFKLY